jgi:hypothetical protein
MKRFGSLCCIVVLPGIMVATRTQDARADNSSGPGRPQVSAGSSQPVHPVLIRNEHGPLTRVVVDTKAGVEARAKSFVFQLGGNQKVFPANYPNYSNSDRRMLAIAHRPAWAGPIGEFSDHDPERVGTLLAEVRPFFRSLNTRQIEYDLPNRPDNMSRHTPETSPQRWGLDSDGCHKEIP